MKFLTFFQDTSRRMNVRGETLRALGVAAMVGWSLPSCSGPVAMPPVRACYIHEGVRVCYDGEAVEVDYNGKN
jgi:hypothetical protein